MDKSSLAFPQAVRPNRLEDGFSPFPYGYESAMQRAKQTDQPFLPSPPLRSYAPLKPLRFPPEHSGRGRDTASTLPDFYNVSSGSRLAGGRDTLNQNLASEPSALLYRHPSLSYDASSAFNNDVPSTLYDPSTLNDAPPTAPSYDGVAAHGAFHRMQNQALPQSVPPQPRKRQRRSYGEIERKYKCRWGGCQCAYGTLNHLNTHVKLHSHGPKRTAEEFKAKEKQKTEYRHPGTPCPADVSTSALPAAGNCITNRDEQVPNGNWQSTLLGQQLCYRWKQ